MLRRYLGQVRDKPCGGGGGGGRAARNDRRMLQFADVSF